VLLKREYRQDLAVRDRWCQNARKLLSLTLATNL
jgi:hypothetical protein